MLEPMLPGFELPQSIQAEVCNARGFTPPEALNEVPKHMSYERLQVSGATPADRLEERELIVLCLVAAFPPH